MALAINDGVLYNNDNAWKDYYVLDDDEDVTWRLFLNADDEIEIEESNKPEDNEIIVDDTTGEICLVSVTADGEVYVKTKREMGANCDEWIRNTNHKVSKILRKMDIGK